MEILRRGCASIANVLIASVLMASAANAATREEMRIKVLDSETRSVAADDNGVPLNCDQLTFDAYCRSSRTAPLINTLLVQEGDGPPFRINCKAESRLSRCVPLPKGVSFEAKREKHGIKVYYIDDQGKARSQLYTLVGKEKGEGAETGQASAASAVQQTAAPTAATPAGAAAGNARTVSSEKATAGNGKENVKCKFTSTPAGAEVTVDGKYVGSTPSVLSVTTGKHMVVVSMAGFGDWKREVDVTAGSDLTVNAVLQKAQ